MSGASTHAEDGLGDGMGLQVTGAPLAQKEWVADEDCS
jgi:hypothetical protein